MDDSRDVDSIAKVLCRCLVGGGGFGGFGGSGGGGGGIVVVVVMVLFFSKGCMVEKLRLHERLCERFNFWLSLT